MQDIFITFFLSLWMLILINRKISAECTTTAVSKKKQIIE